MYSPQFINEYYMPNLSLSLVANIILILIVDKIVHKVIFIV